MNRIYENPENDDIDRGFTGSPPRVYWEGMQPFSDDDDEWEKVVQAAEQNQRENENTMCDSVVFDSEVQKSNEPFDEDVGFEPPRCDIGQAVPVMDESLKTLGSFGDDFDSVISSSGFSSSNVPFATSTLCFDRGISFSNEVASFENANNTDTFTSSTIMPSVAMSSRASSNTSTITRLPSFIKSQQLSTASGIGIPLITIDSSEDSDTEATPTSSDVPFKRPKNRKSTSNHGVEKVSNKSIVKSSKKSGLKASKKSGLKASKKSVVKKVKDPSSSKINAQKGRKKIAKSRGEISQHIDEIDVTKLKKGADISFVSQASGIRREAVVCRVNHNVEEDITSFTTKYERDGIKTKANLKPDEVFAPKYCIEPFLEDF